MSKGVVEMVSGKIGNRGVRWALGSSLVLSAVAAAPAASAQVNGTSLTTYQRSDGKLEKYYAAGDPNLVHGLSVADTVFSDIAVNSPKFSRAGLDEYVPLQLKSWRNRAAVEVMRVLRDEFFSKQNATTGLVPTAFPTGCDRASQRVRGTSMNVRFPYYAARLLEWFPDDELTRSRSHALAEGAITYFAPSVGDGLLNLVDVATGQVSTQPCPGAQPGDLVVFGMDYALFVQGMAMLAKSLNEPFYWSWAAPRLGFLTDMNGFDFATNPLYNERYKTFGPDMTDPNTSTDTHYLIRSAYEGTRLTTSDLSLVGPLRNAAYKWYDDGWYDSWDQCARYMDRASGTPFGDSIWVQFPNC